MFIPTTIAVSTRPIIPITREIISKSDISAPPLLLGFGGHMPPCQAT